MKLNSEVLSVPPSELPYPSFCPSPIAAFIQTPVTSSLDYCSTSLPSFSPLFFPPSCSKFWISLPHTATSRRRESLRSPQQTLSCVSLDLDKSQASPAPVFGREDRLVLRWSQPAPGAPLDSTSWKHVGIWGRGGFLKLVQVPSGWRSGEQMLHLWHTVSQLLFSDHKGKVRQVSPFYRCGHKPQMVLNHLSSHLP